MEAALRISIRKITVGLGKLSVQHAGEIPVTYLVVVVATSRLCHPCQH